MTKGTKNVNDLKSFKEELTQLRWRRKTRMLLASFKSLTKREWSLWYWSWNSPRPMVGLASRTHLRKFHEFALACLPAIPEIARRGKKRRWGSAVRFCKSCENRRKLESERQSSCETTLPRYEYFSFSTLLPVLLNDKSPCGRYFNSAMLLPRNSTLKILACFSARGKLHFHRGIVNHVDYLKTPFLFREINNYTIITLW